MNIILNANQTLLLAILYHLKKSSILKAHLKEKKLYFWHNCNRKHKQNNDIRISFTFLPQSLLLPSVI